MGVRMRLLAAFLCLVGAVWCRPDIVTPHGNFSTAPLSPEDRAWLRKHTHTHRASFPASFHQLFVSQSGQIVENSRPAGHWLQVVGSPATPLSSVYTAADELGKMMRHTPARIFNTLADKGAGVGVFTSQEKLSVYPSYAALRDTAQCRGRCDGSCSSTCTFDGRKWDETAGAGGLIALVLVDNIMCQAHDPYYHHDNIMIHEFAHTTEGYGMSAGEKAQVVSAYNQAHSAGLWAAGSYAMANEAEYFAEGTGVYFMVNQAASPGGMNQCSGRLCGSENAARWNLYNHDRPLYNVLTNIWVSGDPGITSGLRVCP